jgi:hypothetical protein
LALLLLLPMAVVGAQGGDDFVEATLLDLYTIDLAPDWGLGETGSIDAQYIDLVNGDLAVTLILHDSLSILVHTDVEPEEYPEVVIDYIDGYFHRDITRDDLTITDNMAFYETDLEGARYLVAVVLAENDTFVLAYFEAKPEAYDRYIDVILDMVASIQSIDGKVASSEGDATSAASGEPCVLFTDAADGVQLRVGPGMHRGVFSLLRPEDGEVAVIGEAEIDGAQWFRLENEASAANELWVLGADVTTTGDCGTVGEVDAPPVIPASSNPAPTAAPSQPDAVPASDEPAPAANTPAPQASAGMCMFHGRNEWDTPIQFVLQGPDTYVFYMDPGQETTREMIPGTYQLTNWTGQLSTFYDCQDELWVRFLPPEE